MSREALVIFLFGLEAFLTRVSRAQSSAIPSFPQLLGCYWLLKPLNQFLIFFLFLCGPWETTVLFKCRLPYSLAQSFYIKSLFFNRYCMLLPRWRNWVGHSLPDDCRNFVEFSAILYSPHTSIRKWALITGDQLWLLLTIRRVTEY